ncbi:endothelin-converting enzyme 1-like [Ornithodoros turicata]|uniref:endothelin-converting enzyme 1-like n=1 Tax=Ornithodoros turicata TaxID=34597 RepID=UPI003138B0E7
MAVRSGSHSRVLQARSGNNSESPLRSIDQQALATILEESQINQRRFSRQFLGAIVGVVLVFICVGIILAFEMIHMAPSVSETVCDTADCLRLASHLQKSINKTRDPCVNFYSFTCSSWFKDFTYPDLRDYRTFLSSTLMQFMSDGARTTNIEAVARAVRFFTSCTSRKNNVTAFTAFMRDRKLRWPRKPQPGDNALDVHLDLAVNWAVSLWFSIEVSRRDSPNDFVVMLWYGQEVHAWKKSDNGTDATERYKRRVQRCTEILGYPGYLGPGNIVQLRRSEDRTKEIVTKSKIYPAAETLLRAHNLQDITKSHLAWLPLLKKNLQLYFNVTGDTPIWLPNLPFLKELSSLTALLNNSELLNVLGWTFVQEYAWMATTDLDALKFGTVRNMNTTLPYLCLQETEKSFGIVLWAPHIKEQFTIPETLKVDAILDGVTISMTQIIQNSTLIDNSTKKTAIHKVLNATRILWPSLQLFADAGLNYFYRTFGPMNATFIENWVRSRNDVRSFLNSPHFFDTYKKTMLHPMGAVFYLYYLNTIQVSMGVLRPPLYFPKGTIAANFGYLGTLYALFLGKSVDYTGRKIGANGAIKEWWKGEPTAGNCRGRAVEESMRWSLAYRTAYAAYRLALRQQGIFSPKTRLESMTEYSGDQVFYLSACLPYCSFQETGKEACNMAMKTRGFRQGFGCTDEPKSSEELCQYV